ncbi:hypothetical protein AVEN_213222-1 [Araneus ventricosus]|uniref:Tc1-like transposase DDE domain-containing protein n=1 Tax=Araneus ventricosus TaxID=182803 RepID=A0A4Y2JPS5_ARAVE|nr:hypothetical protein AVEN_213222-1 [Araneus ventricosus]
MPHHRTDSVFDTINSVFGTLVIAYQYPNSYWPPYSPDLNPCDFFLWGHMKDLEYKKKPTDFISLKRPQLTPVQALKEKLLNLYLTTS